VRELSAHDRDDRGSLGLHLEGLEVVRDCDEVQLRREDHRRVAPVAVGEDRELSALHEGLQALLDRAEVRSGCAGGGGEGVRVGDVRGERGHHVDVVESRQCVEPQDVAVQRLGTLDDVADDAGVVRDCDPERLLRAHRGCVAVRDRAHAAYTLRDVVGVSRGTAHEDRLHAAIQTAGDPSILDYSVVDFDVDAEVTLDTSDGVDGYQCHNYSPPFLVS
jgi:hypothetical protein